MSRNHRNKKKMPTPLSISWVRHGSPSLRSWCSALGSTVGSCATHFFCNRTLPKQQHGAMQGEGISRNKAFKPSKSLDQLTCQFLASGMSSLSGLLCAIMKRLPESALLSNCLPISTGKFMTCRDLSPRIYVHPGIPARSGISASGAPALPNLLHTDQFAHVKKFPASCWTVSPVMMRAIKLYGCIPAVPRLDHVVRSTGEFVWPVVSMPSSSRKPACSRSSKTWLGSPC